MKSFAKNLIGYLSLATRFPLAAPLLLLLCWSVSAGPLQAQEFQGAVTGTVTDSSGAVVKGAAVTATNTQTGVSFKTVSNNDGIYTILLLPIGSYRVSASASGFDTVVESFDLHGGDRLQINLVLHVGSASQTVTVSSAVPLLETTTGDSGLTVSSQEVTNLPMLGRNPFTLATMAPGLIILPGQIPGNSLRPFDNGGFDTFQVNGGRSETVSSMIDGLADTATDSGSATSPANVVFVPSPDMTQEMRVQTSIYDAQYGRSGGGLISMNLKNGTNQLHGVVYDYYRNAFLNANDYADNRAGNARPPFHWNEPGLEIDGPVFIPKLYNGRDKTFFMFGWEEIRTSTPAPVYESVPTNLERTGNFSESLNGGPVAIYDPLTTVQNPNGTYSRTAFQGNQVPTGRLDPVAQKILPYIPTANLPNAGNVNNLFVGPNNVVDAYDAFAYRVDQTISPTQHIYLAYVYSDRHQNQGLDGFQAAVAPSYLHYRTNYGAHVDWNWIISPSLISSFGVGWNEHRFAIYNHVQNFDLSSVGFPSYVASSPAPSLFPRFTIANYTSFGNANVGTGSYNIDDNYDLRETLTKTFGGHDLSFGGEFRPMRDDKNSAAGNSTFTFGTDFTQANPLAATNGSGNAFASFLLGYADGGAASSSPRFAYRDDYYALFVQDNWRVNSRLSFQMGLRWDTESPQVEQHGLQNVGFNPNASYTFASQALQGEVLFNSSNRNKPYNWDLNNFGPRFGFSYALTHSIVLRGGVGILYSPTWDVPTAVGFSASTSYVASVNNLLTPALPTVLSNPYPQGYLKPAGANTNLNGQGGWTFWANNTRQIPRTTQFSFGFEYQLPSRSVLEVHYTGQLTNNLPNTRNANFLPVGDLALGNALNNQVPNPFAGLLPGTTLNTATISEEQALLPYPQYTTFNEIFTNGTTSYNGLQMRYEKRLSRGFFLQSSYTYSKSMLTGYLNAQDTALRSWIDQYDLPQVVTISGGYSPTWFEHNSHRLVTEAIGGWTMNVMYVWSSGELYAAPTGVEATGVNPRIPNPTVNHEFNTCTITTTGALQNCVGNEQPAWAIDQPFTLSDLTPYYGGLRSGIPPNVNLSVFKAFPVYDRIKLEFRAESFNFVNTPQFGGPSTTVNAATFGARTNFAQNNDPRNIQLALRLSF